MMDPELLQILCCPETRQELRLAEPAIVERLNRQIAAGTLESRAGQPVRDEIEGGLIRADGKVLYPIRRDIPVMLVDEGIGLCDAAPAAKSR